MESFSPGTKFEECLDTIQKTYDLLTASKLRFRQVLNLRNAGHYFLANNDKQQTLMFVMILDKQST